MNLTRVSGPDDQLVTVEDIKIHLRVSHDDEDSYIQGLYDAAMAYIDGPRGVLGRCVLPQRWRQDFPDGLNGQAQKIALPGVSDIVADGEFVAERRGVWSYVSGSETVRSVEFVASTPDDALPALRMAVLLLIGSWYHSREVAADGRVPTEIPFGARSLLAKHKIGWLV